MQIVMVLPVYNEASTLLEVLSGLQGYVDRIVVIDDGSRDRTRDLLRAYSFQHPELFFVSHRTNRGKSGALITAFLLLSEELRRGQIAPGDIIMTMDSDGQHDARDIERLVAPLRQKETDVSLGLRTFEQYPRFKLVGNRFLTWWARRWSGFPYLDAECGFRAMTATVMDDILPYLNAVDYGCEQEMAVVVPRRGWRVQNNIIIHVPVYREGTRIYHGFNNARSAVLAWWRVSHHIRITEREAWSSHLMVFDETANIPDTEGHFDVF